MKQPMLLSMPKARDRRRGQEGPLCLLPELCSLTGLYQQLTVLITGRLLFLIGGICIFVSNITGKTSFSFFLPQRTPLEHCCVRNVSLFISISNLSPGSREAEVQWSQVCRNCMWPSVARSSYWLLPVGRYLSDGQPLQGSVVILAR